MARKFAAEGARRLHIVDLDAATTILAGALQGACLDVYRGRLGVEAIPDTIDHLLRVLGVGTARRHRLAHAAQDFVPWQPLPIVPVDISEPHERPHP